MRTVLLGLLPLSAQAARTGRSRRSSTRHVGHYMRALIWTAWLAACGEGTTSPPDTDLDGDGILDEDDDCPSAAEIINLVFDNDGCPDARVDLYNAVRSDVEAYWMGILSSSQSQYAGISVFQGYAAPLSTACGVLPLRNALYCPATAGVYYDSDFLADYLTLVGDMAPAFIISHELGHHVSWLLDWPPFITTKEAELQADCFGGAWTGDAESRGLLEEGDLDEAVVAVISAGDPDETWFDPTMHGTAAQRVAAFDYGYSGGPAACTSTGFFDAFPASGP